MTESEWNKEIIRDYFRCLRADDRERLLAYMHPTAVLEAPDLVAIGYAGVPGTRAHIERVRALTGASPAIQTNSLLAEGSMVMADTTVQRAMPEGEQLGLRVLWLFELRDRKIARQTLFFGTQEAASRPSREERKPAAA